MKRALIYLTFSAFFIGLTIKSAESVGENAILEFLEEFRKRMCHPIPKFDLPALEPFQIKHVALEADNEYLIDFTGSVTDFRLTGLSDFVVNELKISTNPLRRSIIDFSLPMTAFKSLYTAKGSFIRLLNLNGIGNAAGFLDSFRLSISWLLKAGLHLGIRNLQIMIKIGDFEIDFEKLIEEERINDFVHALVNELGLELLDDIWKDENKFIEKLVEQKINSYIGQYTLADIIKLIGAVGDGPIFDENDPPGDCKNAELKKLTEV